MPATALAWSLSFLAFPLSAAAQSAVSGTISGVVETRSGLPVPRALVSLYPLGAGSAQEVATGSSGSFSFRLIAPGSYEVRAEALGYRPLVARTIVLGGGDRFNLTLTLVEAAPPVVSVDTMLIAGTSSSRWRPGGMTLAGGDLSALPYRFDDLAGLSSLSSAFDASFGAQGLPGSESVVVADGVPIYRAPHPLFRGEQLPDALFPRSAVGSVTLMHNATDVEWAGGSGGYLAVASRGSTDGSPVEIEGDWSGGPLWSSNELDVGSPTLRSYHAIGRTSVEVKPDTMRLFVTAEALQQETPLSARIDGPLAADLAGLDPTVIQALATPTREKISRYSGLAQFFAQPSARSRIFLRGAVGYAQRAFSGMGPVGPLRDPGLAEESTDFSIAGSFINELTPSVSLEFRGGVSGSSRTFGDEAMDLPSAFLGREGLPLGSIPGADASSSRTDVFLLPVLRYEAGAGILKTGISVRASNQTLANTPSGAGDFLFSNASALLLGRGYARSSAAVEASFTTREFGAFVQYDVEPTPGLQLSLGARFDYEQIPVSEARLSDEWLQASGLRNDEFPTTFPQLGGRASLAWDPARDGKTLLYAAGSLHHGDLDPRSLYELYARDGETTEADHSGSGLDWLASSLPTSAAALPTLTLFGPDARAPRSLFGTAGLIREIAAGWRLQVAGDFRRTDFLLRRRNLNLAVAAQATDADGRDVFGTLTKDGPLVMAAADDARRFPDFGPVWALDPDGWSKYRAVSAGLEQRGSSLEFYGSYTYSRTEDNWVGASRGSPGAELQPLLPEAYDGWDFAISDYDVPHRATALLVLPLGLSGSALSATYRFRSGLPFTPGYRRGVDANGDGSFENDVPFVPQLGELSVALPDWPCLDRQAGAFAERNSCRGPVVHALDARVTIGLGRLVGRDATLRVDVFNLIESEDGIVDDALVLVDPAQAITSVAGRVTVPLALNPGFGRILFPSSRGRMLRIGFTIG